MRRWVFLLGGFIAWTVHFFAVYAAASFFPGTTIARWATVAITVMCVAAAGLIAWHALHRWRAAAADEIARWMAGIALTGSAMAAVAILYQGLPALLS